MSRRARTAVGSIALALALLSAPPASSQDAQTGTPPDRIDLTITQPPRQASEAECQRRRDAAIISGEIIVCGNRPTEGPDPSFGSREDARDRYAERTRNQGTLPTPDVAGAGIFRGPATLGGICVPGVFNCPKPPALIVDVTALPQAPPGSDADRIARGLEPLGEDNRAIVERQMTARQRAELGLPDPNAEPVTAPASREGSAAPAAPQ